MGSSRVGVAHVKTMLNLYRHCPTSSAATAATISMPLDLNIILYYLGTYFTSHPGLFWLFLVYNFTS